VHVYKILNGNNNGGYYWPCIHYTYRHGTAANLHCAFDCACDRCRMVTGSHLTACGWALAKGARLLITSDEPNLLFLVQMLSYLECYLSTFEHTRRDAFDIVSMLHVSFSKSVV